MTQPRTSSSLVALTLGAVGIVYGDIGTSPLYAIKQVFAEGRVPLSEANIFGILSLVFWTVTIVVSVKYVVLILRADNNGEGGLVALLSLASQAVRDRPVMRRRLLFIGILGTAIFFGDGVITPAISVISAVEGIEIAAPALHAYIVPITLVILTGFFMFQRFGTAQVGKAFGPIMMVWFVVIAAMGLVHIVRNPAILLAISPHHALAFVLGQPGIAFVALSAVVLCITGAEALYADLGHFGKRPIRMAWFVVAMPALLLNYFGQGAMILREPSTVRNPFYEMAPAWGVYPLIALATVATVIASQALITAAFSVTKQVVQLGYLPRLRIVHTSESETGQVYVPLINWSLYAGVVIAVVFFGSSTRLAGAYGITVTIDMFITTIMTFFVIRYAWKYPWYLVIGATGFFFLVDLALMSANLVKILDGGWFPLLIGALMFTLMMTWKDGRGLMSERMHAESVDLHSFLESVFVSPPTRVPGTAVFLVADQGLTPNALLHNLKHNKVLHERNLFVTVRHHEVPWVDPAERSVIEPLGNGCWQVTINFGFKNAPDVPAALERLRAHGCSVEDLDTSYFLSRDIVIPTFGGGMARWREKLFAGMHRNASAAADFLRLPTNRVVELGAKVEI
ncbi:MAG TPA: potassium transporter Kup [Caldimonas sp.]|nr:potassium transporter Kup [Caldimonas sp.]HEX2542494.1 potassium transporter Kup [Caldimonas sp.]